jgi:hypothetical protein
MKGGSFFPQPDVRRPAADLHPYRHTRLDHAGQPLAGDIVGIDNFYVRVRHCRVRTASSPYNSIRFPTLHSKTIRPRAQPRGGGLGLYRAKRKCLRLTDPRCRAENFALNLTCEGRQAPLRLPHARAQRSVARETTRLASGDSPLAACDIGASGGTTFLRESHPAGVPRCINEHRVDRQHERGASKSSSQSTLCRTYREKTIRHY